MKQKQNRASKSYMSLARKGYLENQNPTLTTPSSRTSAFSSLVPALLPHFLSSQTEHPLQKQKDPVAEIKGGRTSAW